MPIEVEAPTKDGGTQKMIVDRDQGIRPETTMESLAKLAPIFANFFPDDGLSTVTAGNSSQTNDAAAAVMVASKEKCLELGLKPKMKLIGYVAVGS